MDRTIGTWKAGNVENLISTKRRQGKFYGYNLPLCRGMWWHSTNEAELIKPWRDSHQSMFYIKIILQF